MISETKHFSAKTKILSTLGPATASKDMIMKLIDSGVDGVRLNFSHGNHDFFHSLFSEINAASEEMKSPLAILLDLQGPKIRVGKLAEEQIDLAENETIEITTEDIVGTKEKISTSYKDLPRDAQVGDLILIDDGLLRMIITDKKENSVICKVVEGGMLKPRKGMNLPGMKLSTPSITEKDFNDLEFALKYRIDFIALSFVRQPEDITQLRDWLKERNKNIPIISKIEKTEAVERFEEILQVSDGIMVARGDLGVEMAAQDVPIVQKKIINRCNEVGKMVITATQMLESMVSNPIPTRAEASDVANAVWDGTDVVMLSAETSVGEYPVRAVKIMDDIIRKAESNTPYIRNIDYDPIPVFKDKLFDSANSAIVEISKKIEAKAIILFTVNGRTAISVSKYRPDAKIIAFSNKMSTMHRLCLKWGVDSMFMEDIGIESVAVEKAKKMLLADGCLKEGDVVIFAAGAPYSEKSRMNVLRFEVL